MFLKDFDYLTLCKTIKTKKDISKRGRKSRIRKNITKDVTIPA
jgi:hypothetical protein